MIHQEAFVAVPKNNFYIKICGLARLEDADLAVELGSDFLGMVFAEKSKRKCPLTVAQEIKKRHPAKPRVLVFGYDNAESIIEVYSSLRDMLTFIQIPAAHKEFSFLIDTLSTARILPSIAIEDDSSIAALKNFDEHSIVIFDTPGFKNKDGSVMAGGTGHSFSWSLVKDIDRPFLLAGGLTSDNIADAIKKVSPFGFDVASGLEVEPGIKDHNKMKQFFANIDNY